jgi:NH3-dependent NAD+ synthetase
MGFSYEEIDNYLKGKPIQKETKTKIERMIANSAHKRKSLPRPKKINET